MQKLGQHFLKNPRALDAIVLALDIKRNDRIIEIGPGHGELTVPLLRATEKIGAAIASIEKDHALVANLVALSEKEPAGRLTIIEGDALKVLADTVDTIASGAPYKIVGNIPYYITGKLLRIIGELEHKPERVVLMIQKEVAERICAQPPEMNRLAASVQFWADANIVTVVPKKDFSPAPEVDSAVIGLEVKKMPQKKNLTKTARASIDPKQYYETVRGIFAQPRKTLLNNIMAMENRNRDDKNAGGKEMISERLKQYGIDPGARPQDLGIPQIISIAEADLWG